MDLLGMISAIGWKVIPRIHLGPLAVSPHGLGIAIGFGLGGVLLARRAKRFYDVSPEHTWNALMWAVVGVIVGSRLFYIAGHLDEYLSDPARIVRVWEGGVVFYGGAIGGVLAAIPYLRKHGIPTWPMLDAAAPGFPLGLVFGRLGDLAIGDHLGERTDFFLGFRYLGCIGRDCASNVPFIRAGEPPLVGAVYHQTAFYDLISVSLLLPLVLWLGRRPRPRGWLMLLVVTWYAAARFVTDFARTTNTYVGLHGTQWVSLALIVLGVTLLIRKARQPEPIPAHDAGDSVSGEGVADTSDDVRVGTEDEQHPGP